MATYPGDVEILEVAYFRFRFSSFECLQLPSSSSTFACLSSWFSALSSSVPYLLLSCLGVFHHTLAAIVLSCFMNCCAYQLLTTWPSTVLFSLPIAGSERGL